METLTFRKRICSTLFLYCIPIDTILLKQQINAMSYIDTYGVEYSDNKEVLIKCPSSLTECYTVLPSTSIIEEDAFEGCVGLEDVVFPQSLKKIRDRAFRGCSALTSVVIPENVEYLGRDAFYDCVNLQKVIIKASPEGIQQKAFLNCEEIYHISIPGGFGIYLSLQQ